MAKKIFKILGILLLLLILIFIIYFGRKYIIISKLAKARNKVFTNFDETNNYAFSVTIDTNNTIDTEYKFKDGKSIEISKNRQYPENTTITWKDRNTKETITMQPDAEIKKATITNFQDSNVFDELPLGWDNILSDKFESIFTYKIENEKIEGKEYYVLTSVYGVVGLKYYFNKDTLFLEKEELLNGPIYYNKFETNTVTDEDVMKPDLTGYEVSDFRK